MLIKTGIRALGVGVTALAAITLGACNGGGSDGGATGGGTGGAALSGQVMGGNQPVTGSLVKAFKAGVGTVASAATPVACVTTSASGSFQFVASGATCTGTGLPTSFTPAGGSFYYLVATGGNPGLTAGTNNTAIALMAVLGTGPTLPPSVSISELTTVAGAYALAQMISGTPGGAIPTRLQQVQARNVSAKSPWIGNSMTLAQSLVNIATSKIGSGLPLTSACTGSTTDPINCDSVRTIDSVADALAACVNTTSSASTACKQLFCFTTPGAPTFSTSCSIAPATSNTDTLTAAVSVALNPGTISISGLFSLVGASPPFVPTYTGTPPNDWTLAVNYRGFAGLNQPSQIAIDGTGNLWILNFAGTTTTDSFLSEITNNAVALSSTGFQGGGLAAPNGLAVDKNGNVWVANAVGHSVSEFNSAGTALSPSAGFQGGGLFTQSNNVVNDTVPHAVAIDQSGNVWITDPISFADSGFGGNVVVLNGTNGNTAVSPAGGFTGTLAADGIAIDGSGNAWVGDAINPGALEKYTTAGQVTTLGTSGFLTGGGLFSPESVAIDPSGNVWAANLGEPNPSNANQQIDQSVSKFSNAGAVASNSPYLVGGVGGNGGANTAIAIDAAGNVWVTDVINSVVGEINNSGAALAPSTGFFATGVDGPTGIAIDSSGNVWVANQGDTTVEPSGSLTEIIGAAAPVKTPMIGVPVAP